MDWCCHYNHIHWPPPHPSQLDQGRTWSSPKTFRELSSQEPDGIKCPKSKSPIGIIAFYEYDLIVLVIQGLSIPTASPEFPSIYFWVDLHLHGHLYNFCSISLKCRVLYNIPGKKLLHHCPEKVFISKCG